MQQYFRSNISSNESDIIIYIGEVFYWQVIDRMKILSLQLDKMGILSNRFTVCFITCIQQNREKVKWELQKKTGCSFAQILEAALHKTVAVLQHASHLTNHPRKMNKKCWALLEKQGHTYKWHFAVVFYTWVHKYWLTSKGLYIKLVLI